jgi:hypothetical protein
MYLSIRSFSDEFSNDNEFPGVESTLNIKENQQNMSNIVPVDLNKPSNLSNQQTKPFFAKNYN